jgi:hypothetical protein
MSAIFFLELAFPSRALRQTMVTANNLARMNRRITKLCVCPGSPTRQQQLR